MADEEGNLEREQVVGGREASRQGEWSWAAGCEKKAGGQARSWLAFVEYKTTASEAAAAAGGPGEGQGAGTDSSFVLLVRGPEQQEWAWLWTHWLC